MLRQGSDTTSPGADRGPCAGERADVEAIPVLRPQLPTADRLLPYLRRIDTTRTYTNWGPLTGELERRLAQQFGVLPGSVISAASGTTALIGAILASAGRATVDRPIALIPALTFVATASAAEQCGYRPHLIDVDMKTWLIDPAAVASRSDLDRVGVVIAVAAFGRPWPQQMWTDFRERTGIPVVIDAAAGFEALLAEPDQLAGRIPISMSFHATKAFATGEGGCVITTDLDLAARVTEALNFGFFDSRDSRVSSTNGKMSEYHAAVGLAELDGWTAKRAALLAVAARYRNRFTGAGLGDRVVTAPQIASCYGLFRCEDDDEMRRVQEFLTRAGIESRTWYGRGLHGQPYFLGSAHDTLPNTDSLARLLGLPIATDLPDRAVSQVVDTIQDAVRVTGTCLVLPS